ncbi:L,D-transpeptidase, partial [Streptomyces spectabilis]|uniref:L,D-transpeptidase n=1 Tax=Streptomyces spectabilis TaxID=68270 RepID=UPI0033D73C5D
KLRTFTSYIKTLAKRGLNKTMLREILEMGPESMTVVAKHRVKRLTSESVGLGDEYDVKLPWVVELRGPDGRANFILAMTYAEGAPGVRDSTRGAIGLRSADARWVYEQLSPGAVVTVRG